MCNNSAEELTQVRLLTFHFSSSFVCLHTSIIDLFLNHLRTIADMRLNPQIFWCIFLKSKDTHLPDCDTVTCVRKLKGEQNYPLAASPPHSIHTLFQQALHSIFLSDPGLQQGTRLPSVL
jgi:hypothetical protein